MREDHKIVILETIQKCYCTDSVHDKYLRGELECFIEGLRRMYKKRRIPKIQKRVGNLNF